MALTYNLLLAKCADDNELERAEELIERMADDDVVRRGFVQLTPCSLPRPAQYSSNHTRG